MLEPPPGFNPVGSQRLGVLLEEAVAEGKSNDLMRQAPGVPCISQPKHVRLAPDGGKHRTESLSGVTLTCRRTHGLG